MRQASWLGALVVAVSGLLIALAPTPVAAHESILDFGHIEMTLTGTGTLVGFASISEDPEPLPEFLQDTLGLVPIRETSPATFPVPWTVVREGNKVELETFLKLSNFGNGTLTIQRKYFNHDGFDCTQDGPQTTTLGPRQAVIVVVSTELENPCASP